MALKIFHCKYFWMKIAWFRLWGVRIPLNNDIIMTRRGRESERERQRCFDNLLSIFDNFQIRITLLGTGHYINLKYSIQIMLVLIIITN